MPKVKEFSTKIKKINLGNRLPLDYDVLNFSLERDLKEIKRLENCNQTFSKSSWNNSWLISKVAFGNIYQNLSFNVVFLIFVEKSLLKINNVSFSWAKKKNFTKQL
ncbi:MAG: hypothetical protein LBR43_04010 [Spiroplasmataceae bacterium]|nr:hypothetical protein [Spiroplasmataceae bacterium]